MYTHSIVCGGHAFRYAGSNWINRFVPHEVYPSSEPLVASRRLFPAYSVFNTASRRLSPLSATILFPCHAPPGLQRDRIREFMKIPTLHRHSHRFDAMIVSSQPYPPSCLGSRPNNRIPGERHHIKHLVCLSHSHPVWLPVSLIPVIPREYTSSRLFRHYSSEKFTLVRAYIVYQVSALVSHTSSSLGPTLWKSDEFLAWYIPTLCLLWLLSSIPVIPRGFMSSRIFQNNVLNFSHSV